MNIKKIVIDGFKSFYNRTEIDFDEIKGLWRISGDVGAGKTSIGEAIMYGLFGDIKGKNNADLVSWGLKKGFMEIWCECNNRNIYIKREFRLQGQASLYVTVDDEELIFTNKRDAQGQLEREYYDISRMTLELLCIVSFNNFKSITTLNAADTKKFLDQVFGFYIITQYSDITKEFKNESIEKENEISRSIDNIQMQINKILELSNKTKIEGDMGVTEEEIKSIKETHKGDTIKLKERENEMNIQLRELQSKLSEIKTLGLNKKREIDFIKQGICPTCGAPIDQAQLPIKEKEKEVLGEQYKEYSDKYKDVEAKFREKQQKWNKLNDERNGKIIELTTFLTQLKEQASRTKINTTEIDKLKRDIEDLQKQLMASKKDTEEWNQLFDVLTTHMRADTLSNFIPILNQNIARYMSQLHQPYELNFSNDFKSTLSIFGVEREIPVSSLSTGQLKTVDMTAMLGVLSVIMHNVNFNIMFLDELISNMHSDLRDMVCEVLKSSLQPGQTIFLISHADLNSSYLDGEIETKINLTNRYNKETTLKINHF